MKRATEADLRLLGERWLPVPGVRLKPGYCPGGKRQWKCSARERERRRRYAPEQREILLAFLTELDQDRAGLFTHPTVHRIFRALTIAQRQGRRHTSTSLASALDEPRSTVERFLAALMRLDLVARSRLTVNSWGYQLSDRPELVFSLQAALDSTIDRLLEVAAAIEADRGGGHERRPYEPKLTPEEWPSCICHKAA